MAKSHALPYIGIRPLTTALLFLCGGILLIVEQTLLFAPQSSCWFYDANRGEASLSERLSLACYALAAGLCLAAYRKYAAKAQPAYLALLFLIIVCFLEEANYGQVFISNDALFFDRQQWAWHTSTAWLASWPLDVVLSVIVALGLPLFLGQNLLQGASSCGFKLGVAFLLSPPALWQILVGLCAASWDGHLPWQNGRFLCHPYPEEVHETLIAVSFVYLLLQRHLLEKLPQPLLQRHLLEKLPQPLLQARPNPLPQSQLPQPLTQPLPQSQLPQPLTQPLPQSQLPQPLRQSLPEAPLPQPLLRLSPEKP